MIGNILRSKTLVAMALSASMTANASDLLNYVPGDTAFFMGTTTALPMKDLAAAMPNYGDLFEQMLAEDDGTSAGGMADSESEKLFLAFAQGYMNFMNQPMKTLADYGVAEPMEIATYMSGVTPVLRIKLDDPKRFEAALSAFDARHQLNAEQGEQGGVYYRRYAGMHPKQADGVNADLIVATQANMAVFTLDFKNPAMLARALGNQKPAVSLATTGHMDAINRKWEYSGEFSFFLDFKALLNQYGSANSSMRQDLMALLPVEAAEQLMNSASSPQCMGEMQAVTDVFPRIVGGYRSIDRANGKLNMVNHMAMEVNYPELMSALAMLRGHISPAIAQADSVVGFGLGFDAAQLMPAMQQIGSIVSNLQPQCEHFTTLVENMAAGIEGMSMSAAMMGAMVPGFKGFSVAVYDPEEGQAQKVSSNPFDLSSWNALMLISSDQPDALLQSAQMFPPLAGVTLPSDGSAVNLRDTIEANLGMPVDLSAARRGDHIALFNGQTASAVADSVGNASANKNGLVYFRVNMRKYMALVFESMVMAMGSQGAMTDEDQRKFAEILELYPEGSSDFALDVTPNGIEGLSYTAVELQ